MLSLYFIMHENTYFKLFSTNMNCVAAKTIKRYSLITIQQHMNLFLLYLLFCAAHFQLLNSFRPHYIHHFLNCNKFQLSTVAEMF